MCENPRDPDVQNIIEDGSFSLSVGLKSADSNQSAHQFADFLDTLLSEEGDRQKSIEHIHSLQG